MKWKPIIGIVIVMLVSVIVLFFSGCQGEVERRRRHTVERLDWGAGTEETRRVRDALSNAVAGATARSLASPWLVDASLWLGSPENSNGFLKVEWISDSPKADGLAVLFTDSAPEGAAFDRSDVNENEKIAREVVVFNAVVIREGAPQLWGKLAAAPRVRVVLTMNGKPVSNELDVRSIPR